MGEAGLLGRPDGGGGYAGWWRSPACWAGLAQLSQARWRAGRSLRPELHISTCGMMDG